MKVQDLKQLIYLNKEIEYKQNMIIELETRATHITQTINDMPGGNKKSDKVADNVAEITDIKLELELQKRRANRELRKLVDFVNTIEDSQLRLIFSYRYINNLTWRQIALHIGGGNTEYGVKMKHNRYLRKVNR